MSGTARTRAALEALFARGDKPSAQDVADLLASCYNLTDDDCADQLADAVTTALFAGIWSGLPLDPATSKARLSTLLARLASAHETLVTTVDGNTTAIAAVNADLLARPRRNLLINGGFDLWQRATSQTTSGYGSDDRWANVHNGSSKTVSRQPFTLGQTDVPGNPKWFSRTVVSSVAGAANYVIKLQRIEGVQCCAGETVTLSFYAKADANRPIAVSLYQNFGTTGGSAEVVGIGAQKVALTSTWQRFVLQIDVPSIAGKVLGSGNNDFLGVYFWFDAGSDYNSFTDTLGQQSGTFDLANIQLERGDQATDFELIHVAEQLSLAQRYYESGGFQYCFARGASELTPYVYVPFKVTKRASPAVTATWSGGTGHSVTATPTRLEAYATGTFLAITGWTADAEL